MPAEERYFQKKQILKRDISVKINISLCCFVNRYCQNIGVALKVVFFNLRNHGSVGPCGLGICFFICLNLSFGKTDLAEIKSISRWAVSKVIVSYSVNGSAPSRNRRELQNHADIFRTLSQGRGNRTFNRRRCHIPPHTKTAGRFPPVSCSKKENGTQLQWTCTHPQREPCCSQRPNRHRVTGCSRCSEANSTFCFRVTDNRIIDRREVTDTVLAVKDKGVVHLCSKRQRANNAKHKNGALYQRYNLQKIFHVETPNTIIAI